MPTLKIISGMNTGKRYDWTDRELTIGREITCQVVLPSRTISRQHARILRESDGFYLEDLRSVNGTSVNGQTIERRTRLSDGDRLQIYDTVLMFFEEPPSDVAPLPNGKVEPPVTDSDQSSSQHINVRDFDFKGTSGDHAAATLHAVLKITRSIGSSFELDKILPNIMECLFEIFPQTQRGYILQTSKTLGELTPVAIKHGADESDTISPISATVAQNVMKDGTAFLSSDVASDDRLGDVNDSIFEEPSRSMICAPLMGPSATAMGVIQLESNDARDPFDLDDLELLVSVALLAGQAVEFSQLHESLLELDWRHREVVLAKDVQLKFLPAKVPQIPRYGFHHFYQAADFVAGDYYDYVDLPDGRLAIVQADVSGKGVGAALIVARLCAEVRYSLLSTETPAQAISRLNHVVCHQIRGDSFITCVVCILDPQQNRLVLANAGHPRPLIRRKSSGEVSMIFDGESGFPLGVHGDAEYQDSAIELQPGDIVFCYTDGVNEQANPDGKMYGDASVREAIRHAGTQPRHVVNAVLADLRGFAAGGPTGDDVCIVCFSRDE